MSRSPRGHRGRLPALIYFDTNVYSAIVRDRGVDDVRRLLRRTRTRLLASSHNLLETFRAPVQDRVHRIEAIVALARIKEVEPSHYRTAMEIRNEIRRLRPLWLQSNPDLRRSKSMLARYRQLWSNVASDPHYTLPQADLLGQSARYLINSQKARRAGELSVGRQASRLLPELKEKYQPYLDRMPKEEAYWRIASAANWWYSLRDGRPLDDYRDWLLPYLELERITPDDWTMFWIGQIQAVRDRSLRFVEYFQTSSRTDAGNFEDLLHATYMFDVDAVATSDARFYGHLSQLQKQPWIGKCALPLFLGGDGRSAATVLGDRLLELSYRMSVT